MKPSEHFHLKPNLSNDDSAEPSHWRIVLPLLAMIIGMAGLAYGSVPLYRLFCQVTGYGGTTQTGSPLPDHIGTKLFTVSFDTNVAPGLDWSFSPPDAPVTLHAGEQQLVSFTATNRSDHPISGTATFNVTPFKAGSYFDKIQCFCFDAQTLQPGETVHMPVSFFIDPDIENDPYLSDVSDIILSYTFFASKEE